MSRPKFEIEPSKAFWIMLYFLRGMEKDSCLKHLTSGWEQAKNTLKSLYDRPLLNTAKKKETLAIMQELKTWLETYASDEDWTRCQAAIRQRTFGIRQNMKTVKFPAKAHWVICEYANKVNLPVWEAIFQLVQKEDDRLFSAKQAKALAANAYSQPA